MFDGVLKTPLKASIKASVSSTFLALAAIWLHTFFRHHRTQDPGPETWDTGPRAQDLRPKTQVLEPKSRDSRPKTQDPGLQNLGPQDFELFH